MSGSAFPSKVTQVDLGTTASPQRFPLGYEVTLPAPKQSGGSVTADAGSQTWIYIFNDDAASLVQGNVVARDASTVTYDGIKAAASTPSMRVLGVAQHTIAAGSYGFILRKGLGEVLAGTGTIDDDEGLCVDTTDAGTAMEFGGIAEAQDGTSTEHGISGPFGWATEDAVATALATCWINCQG